MDREAITCFPVFFLQMKLFRIRFFWLTLTFVAIHMLSFKSFDAADERKAFLDSLRNVYARSPDRWPKPTLDSGVMHFELGMIPPSPLANELDSLQPLIALGKVLFFDPRLSGSNQISCSSCHVPDMHFTDGRRIALGHDHQLGTRNTNTVQNLWAYEKLFWDGRANSPEHQALHPIENKVEMNQDLKSLSLKLSRIKGYRPLFEAAFQTGKITNEKIAKALATFQLTISSPESDFDFFLGGQSSRLTDEQVEGLHLFRTKGRCMNCHNGPFFTDGQFHNLAQTNYNNPALRDLGLYETTKNPADVGKFKTPGLRNVTKTGPWMHNGSFVDLTNLMAFYNVGFGEERPNSGQENDPLFPKISPHIKPLGLNAAEIRAIVAFLESISTTPANVTMPKLPK